MEDGRPARRAQAGICGKAQSGVTSERIDGWAQPLEDGESAQVSPWESMRIKFWGVRGSTPTPQPDNLRYGGNTSCVEVRIGDSLYVFDCGTGLRALGQQLQRDSQGKSVRAHIFVSHFHWDHIQGIPFFGPLYDTPENCFSFHSSSRFRTLKRVMEEQMAAPYFP